ncbi:phosphate signaling complex protein PhoU [Rickettsiales bacterium]|nr:phosphate signaling complex protein PhoU [Rickettsiales bacterium]
MQRNLKEHTVSSFDKDLSSISCLIKEMSELTIESVDIVDQAIKTGDKDLISNIKEHDQKINKYHSIIDDEITAFIALRQPKAYDLRFSVSAVKVSSNLERVGDYAKTVIKKIVNIEILEDRKNTLLNMTKLSRTMIKDSVSAIIENDLEKAEKVLASDDKIDDFYQDIFNEFSDNKISENSRELINVIFIAKAIERLADHAVNIAAIVEYNVNGEIK